MQRESFEKKERARKKEQPKETNFEPLLKICLAIFLSESPQYINLSSGQRLRNQEEQGYGHV